MSFDRKGKCPICRQPFRSEKCPHSWAYVHDVVTAASTRFNEDVQKLRKRRRRNKK